MEDAMLRPAPLPAPRHQPLPERGKPQAAPNGAAFVASAVFAAGIASFIVFDHAGPQPAAPRSGAAVPEVPPQGYVPPALVSFSQGDRTVPDDGLVPFLLASGTGHSVLPLGPVPPFRLPAPWDGEAAKPRADAARTMGPMVEEAPERPRLRLLANILRLADRSEKDGFAALKLRRDSTVWTMAFLPTPARAPEPAPQAQAAAAPVPAAAGPKPRERQFRSMTGGARSAPVGQAHGAVAPAFATAVAAVAAAPAQAALAAAPASPKPVSGGKAVLNGWVQLAQMPGVQPQTAGPVVAYDTNHFRGGYQDVCGDGVRCHQEGGKMVMEYDGMRVAHSYDGTLGLGLRNRYEVTAADGRRYELTASPLVFDLDGDGVRTSRRLVRFDVDGDAVVDRFHDVSSKDGVLVFDADGNGVAGDNARELFGDRTDLDGDGRPDGFRDGFEALGALAAKAVRLGLLPARAVKDGRLDSADLERLAGAFGLGMPVGSLRAKTVTLREAGVAAVLLSSATPEKARDFDGQGDDVLRQPGAEFVRADGTKGSYEDVWFRAAAPRLVARK